PRPGARPRSPMSVLQRLFGVLAILLGLAGFVLCVAGIIAGWVYQKPLTERTTTVFGRVERPLDVAIRSLRQVNTSLDRARANLKTIQETHGPAAPPPTETNFFRRMAV